MATTATPTGRRGRSGVGSQAGGSVSNVTGASPAEAVAVPPMGSRAARSPGKEDVAFDGMATSEAPLGGAPSQLLEEGSIGAGREGFQAAHPPLGPLGRFPSDDLRRVRQLGQLAQPEEVLRLLVTELEQSLELGLVAWVEARIGLERKQGRVALPQVSVERLPEEVGIAVDIEEVVPDLERHAEGPPVPLEGIDPRGFRTPDLGDRREGGGDDR